MTIKEQILREFATPFRLKWGNVEVDVLLRPLGYDEALAMSRGVEGKTEDEVNRDSIARCVLDPTTKEAIFSADDIRELPISIVGALSTKIGELNQAASLEAAQKNSNGARAYKRRSRSRSESESHSTTS